ncbi:MAG: ABC-2 type transport system ATP-binding protein, partial [Anaerolineales bacterium]|nr:ABC-2 type transport system ATP-binding protein [Anaerolineales bacterium]
DPVGAREIRQVVRDLQAADKTILLTTHYMFEADALCQRVAVINHGRLVALDTPQGLKRLVRDQAVIEVELFGVPPEVVERIRREPYVDAVSVEDQDQRQLLLVQSSRGAEAVQDVLDQLRDLRVGKVNVREPTLEDAYVRLVEGTP